MIASAASEPDQVVREQLSEAAAATGDRRPAALRAAHDLTVHVPLADVDVVTVVERSLGKPVPGDTPGTGTLVQRFEHGSVVDTRSASPG